MKLIGNENMQKQIYVASQSAKKENRSVPHMLFAGAAGCGKTSMAKRVARISSGIFISVLPESLKRIDDIISLFDRLDYTNYNGKGDQLGDINPGIIFIDEIHNLKPLQIQEWLGIVMENFELYVDNQRYWIPDFTMIGATTNDGLLSKPFLDRFKMRFIFRPYNLEQSAQIVIVHAERLNLAITMEAAQAIAQRGRGVPRILVGYLERCRDTAQVHDARIITEEIVKETFTLLGVDDEGLRETELRLMEALYEANIPVGIENLSIIINEAPKTMANAIEPFLIQKGYIVRSGQGRMITKRGREYLEESGFFGAKKFKRQAIPADYIRRRVHAN